MQRLVEGCESDFQIVELRDNNLGENEVSCAKKSKQKKQPENPALGSSTGPTCIANELTDSECNPRNAYCANPLSEESTQNPEEQRRRRENLRIYCDELQQTRLPKCVMIVLVVIFMLMAVGSLVLAILTSLKVAKLEESSMLAACPKGNEEPIDCKHIQEMNKSLKGALRELKKTKEQLGFLKNATIKDKENQTSSSSHGANDTLQGLTGAPVTPTGPPTRPPTGPTCSCNLSLCSYKTEQSTGVSSGSGAQASVSAMELKDMKFLGVNCGTNDGKVVILSSTIVADGKRTYTCTCKGTFDTPSVSLYCYIYYWECPLNLI